MSRVLRALGLLAVTASALSAQVQVKQFSVVTRLGAVTPERASSLNTGALIGLDTEYALSKYFGIGTSVPPRHAWGSRPSLIMCSQTG